VEGTKSCENINFWMIGIPDHMAECNWCHRKIRIEDYSKYHNMGMCRDGY